MPRLVESFQTAQWAYRAVWRHPNNRGMRKPVAVGRFTAFQVRGRVFKRRTVVSIGSHSRFCCDVAFGATWRAAMGNPPDPTPMAAWQHLLVPGGLFVDGGANAGTYSIFGLDCGAEVIAIEPNLQSRELLLANLALNHYTCTVLSCALSDKPGTIRFTTDLDVRNRISAEGVEIEAGTLDDIVGERFVNGIKLDIEGAELLALQGAKRLLRERRVKAIQLEWSDMSLKTLGQDRNAVAELLQTYGYYLSRPDKNGRLRKLTTFEFGRDVFATRDHPAE